MFCLQYMRVNFFLVFLISLASCKNDNGFSPYGGTSLLDISKSPEIITVDIPNKHEINFETDTLTYLAFGDSYTIGTGVDKSDRWPNQYVEKLNSIKIHVDNAEIVAGAGWTTGDLLKVLEDRKLAAKYDLVSLLIGVNNQYQGNLFTTFQTEFINLLKFSLEKSKSRNSVFVLSIPDYGITPFGGKQTHISDEIDMYNSWIQETCEANKIKYYNITEISRKAENDLRLLAKDELHPSGIMYSEWVNLIIEDLPDILQR